MRKCASNKQDCVKICAGEFVRNLARNQTFVAAAIMNGDFKLKEDVHIQSDSVRERGGKSKRTRYYSQLKR